MECFKCHTPIPHDSRFCLSCGADVSGGSSAERTQGVQIDHDLGDKLREELGAAFSLERELGRGGMAVVFLATELDLGRKVAIKVLPPELTFGGGMVERFKREARTAATLDHPNIIPIYRVAPGGKLFWYAMKYLEGESLSDVIQRDGRLDLDRAAAIIHQVADALDYAHEHGVIHRDVKPANIMLDARGRVTVTDFGIAKAVQNASMTGSGSMIGTPYYMSPEQCSGKKVTGQSDQYSLGVMAYQMLSGHLPFTGDSVFDIVKQHCMDPPPPLSELRPDLPKPLIAVVEQALAKNPADRFASENEFAKAFAAAASGQPVSLPARPGASQRKSVTADLSPVPEALRGRRAPFAELSSVRDDRTGRKRWIIPASIVGVAVLAGTGVLLGKLLIGGPAAGETALSPSPPSAAQPGESSGSATNGPPAGGSQTGPSPGPSGGAAPPPTSEVAAAVPQAGRTVRFGLTGLPAGAAITRNGRHVNGRSWSLESGTAYSFQVTAPGYELWAKSITAGPSTPPSMRVDMVRKGAPTTQPSSGGATEPTAAAPPEPSPAVSTTARITVGSRPSGAMWINGRPSATNPVSDYEVPAGPVRLRFTVTDSAGIWTVDTTVVVAPGETRTFGYIRLRRP